MSKSLWSRSVWETLLSRVSGSRRLSRRRRTSSRNNWKAIEKAEALEQRVVLAAAAITLQTNATGTTLNINSTAGTTDEVVTVRAGAAFTDILIGKTLTSRLEGVTSADITTINFDGKGGTSDSLNVVGITATLTINLTDIEKLQLNTVDTTVNSATATDSTLTLVTSMVTGALSITHDGDITQSGNLIVSGTTTMSAGAGTKDITLRKSGNAFGDLAFNANDINIVESGPTSFNGTTATGTLTVVSSGAITTTGSLLTVSGTGATSLTSNGSSIDVTGAFSSSGTISLKGSTVSLTDTSASSVDLQTVTASSSLEIVAQGGAIVETSGKITVGGLATFTTGTGAGSRADITLTGGTNNFGSLAVTGRTINITEKSSTDLTSLDAVANGGGGNLTLTSSGAITDSGDVNVAGTTVLSAKSAPITLDDSANTFTGSVTFTGTNVTLVDDDGATVLGASVAKGTFNLTTTGAGAGVSQTGNLTVSGRMTVDAGSKAIDLDDGAGSITNKFGSISVIGTVVAIEESDASDLFDSTVATSFQLTSGGAVTDSGTMDNNGTTTIASGSGKAITLDDSESAFDGTINLSGGGAGTVINSVGSVLGNITLKSFTLTSGDGVSQTTATSIAITGRLTINATSTITLDAGTGTDNFGSMSLFGTTVNVIEDSASDLFDSEITGNFNLTSLGAVTDSGVVIVDGATTIAADTNGATAGGKENITLNSVGSMYGDGTLSTGELNLDGAVVSVADYSDETELGLITTTGALTITAVGGNITDDNNISVGGTTKFDAVGHNITIDDLDNTFTGSISFFGEDATLVTGANAQGTGDDDVVLGTTKVANLSITTDTAGDGDLSQSGSVTVLEELKVDTGAGDVNLTGSGFNSFGWIEITDATVVNILERGGMVLDDMTVTGTLTLTATGGITDTDDDEGISGKLTITGVATLSANGGDLILESTDSEFNAQVNLTGGNIEITNIDTASSNGFSLGNVTATGDFTLTSTAANGAGNDGNVVQVTGTTVNVDGLVTITATETGTGKQDITVDKVDNSFGKLAFDGANVTINEDDADGTFLSELADATGVLTIITDGNINSDTDVNVTGITHLEANAGAGTITLTDGSNTFTGALELQASAVTIVNDTSTILGSSATAGDQVDVESLTLTTTGTVTQLGDLTVDDLLDINATGSVDLTGTNATGVETDLFSLRIDATSANIVEDNGFMLDGVDLTGNLTISVSGDLTDASGLGSGTISVGGNTSITATGGGDIILDHTTSGDDYDFVTGVGTPDATFGDGATDTVTLSGATIKLASGSDILFSDVTATGDLLLAIDGNVSNVTGTGTFGRFNITGDTTIDASLGANDHTISLDLFNATAGVSSFGTPPDIRASIENTTNPTVVVSGPATASTGVDFTVIFTFDSPVSNFVFADITISSGFTMTSFTPNGTNTVFTLVGSFAATGTKTFFVGANVAQETSGGLGNLLSNTLSVVVS